MKQTVVLFALFAVSWAAPQYSYPYQDDGKPGYNYKPPATTYRPRPQPPPENEEAIDAGGNTPRPPPGDGISVLCRRQQTGEGKYQFICDGVPPERITISNEHILWLKSPVSEPQQLDIVVPNYRVEELIRAALKAGKGGQTNINILLKKPDQVYDVQAQDGQAVATEKPTVNLQYEAVGNPSSAHYPVDKPYNRLTGPIREPGASQSNTGSAGNTNYY